jgi:hypothetical protein
MFKLPAKEITNSKRLGRVRQANALIRSKQPLDLMQKRLFYLILETIRTTDTQFETVEFPVPVLKELLSGTYGSFQTDLKNAADGLVMTSFSIFRASGSWATTPIFDRIEYLNIGETNEQGHTNDNNYDVIRARLHDSLESYLLKLERNYNSQNLVYVLTIPRVRSHRLYEILLHESWRGERPEFEMDINELQAFLGIEDSYKRWQDFKRTLKRQQDIVHEYTDLRLEFEGVRTGRSVTRVQFKVSFVPNTQRTLAQGDPHTTIEEIQLANELKEAGYEQDPYDTIRAYGVAQVRTSLKQARAARKAAQGSKSEIRNFGGFIHYLLQKKTDEAPAEAEPKTLTADEIRAVTDNFVEVYEQARDDLIEQLLEALDEKARDDLTTRVFKLMNPSELKLIENNALAYPAIRNRYIIENSFLILPEHYVSANSYYRGKDLGFDEHTNQKIRSYLLYSSR